MFFIPTGFNYRIDSGIGPLFCFGYLTQPEQPERCCNARIRVRNNFISFAFGLSNDERMSWKMLWRVVLFFRIT